MKKFFLAIAILPSFFGNAQQTDVVDFLKVEAEVQPISSERKIIGSVSYSFKILKQTDSIYLDAIAMKLKEISPNQNILISAEQKKIWFTANFKAGETYTVSFEYEAFPKQTLYFSGEQIWTQGQGKYTSHWLPSLDDTNDKIEFDLQVISPKDKTVIANGKFLQMEEMQWCFDMKEPMSSYLVAFAIGDFERKEMTSKSGIPIELYYKPKDSLKFEPTYRYTKEIFDFLETEIGMAYPWQNYKQVPVRDFLYAGMENTTLTIFSEAFVVDSLGFADRNYVNVNAHELAHQWFGNLVTATSVEHHWLQEGFSTYYALLAEKEIFGEDYFYWKLYNSAEQLKALSDEGKGESILNPKASSLTFYEKGAWALHILKEEIGEEAFKNAVKNYLEKHSFKNVDTEDFLAEIRLASGKDISKWEADWLQQSAFQSEQAYQSLLKSEFINKYFEVSALRTLPLADKKLQLKIALTFPNDFIGQEAVFQLMEKPFAETISLYKNGFESKNLFVRQAIALSLNQIPTELQPEYESLLKDDSYVTREAALYNLWVNFPEKRAEYLNQTEGVIGFQDKNVRQLWLALSFLTEGYKTKEKEIFTQELKSYSGQEYSFEIREKAFGYINELQLWDDNTLKNLIESGIHHTWQFSKYSKELLLEVLKNPVYSQKMEVVRNKLSVKALTYLDSVLKK